MTFEEDDLRAALLQESADIGPLASLRERTIGAAEPLEPIVVELRPTASPRRRRLIAGAAAAAVVGLAVGTATLLPSSSRPSSGAAGSSDSAAATTGPPAPKYHSTGITLAWDFVISVIPGFSVESRRIETNRQVAVLADTVTPIPGKPAGRSDVARVYVYAAGQYTGTIPTGATAVSVNNKPGYYGMFATSTEDLAGAPTTTTQPTLLWQWAPNAWAVVVGTSAEYQTQDVESRLATAVAFGRSRVSVPVSVPSAPAAGLVRTQLSQDADGSTTVLFVKAGATKPFGQYDAAMTLRAGQSTQPSGGHCVSVGPVPSGSATSVTVVSGGVSYSPSTTSTDAPVEVCKYFWSWVTESTAGGYTQTTWLSSGGPILTVETNASIRAAVIAYAPNVVGSSDRSTWFDATVAIP
jgi:hypothetical protein